MAQPYAGLRIGRQRVPIEKKYPQQTLNQHMNSAPQLVEASAKEALQQYQDSLHVKGAAANFNERDPRRAVMSLSPGPQSIRKKTSENNLNNTRPESGKSNSVKDEVEANMKNIRGYQKKGLLNVIDRETTHYNSNNKVPTKPPTPLQKNRGTNRNGDIAIQSSTITEDTLAESKRMTATNRKPAPSSSAYRYQQPQNPYPVKKGEIDKVGIKAFSSVNEIQRYLENPQLI